MNIIISQIHHQKQAGIKYMDTNVRSKKFYMKLNKLIIKVIKLYKLITETYDL